MFRIFYITPYFLLLACHAKHTRKGPPCYGRSDCVNPFTETTENVTELSTTDNIIPKRYIVIHNFRSPIFGAYKYDPILGDFIMPNKSTSGLDFNRDALMMRASEDPIPDQNNTLTEEISKPLNEEINKPFTEETSKLVTEETSQNNNGHNSTNAV